MDANTVKQILEAISKPEITKLDAEHAFALVPQGMRVEDLSEILPPPERVRQVVDLLNVDSFIGYVKLYQGFATTVFADEPGGEFEAVIDYHHGGQGARGTLDHLVHYACPLSEQWKAWLGHNGKWFGQVDFATFLESNLKEIFEPAGAVFLQVALELQVHKAAEFESEVRLDNGQTRFRYQESVRGQTKAGDLEIPTAFKLALPVFIDGTPRIVEARFRYRMDSGKLTLGYELIRPQEAYNKAIKEVTETIVKGLPDVKVYVGKRR